MNSVPEASVDPRRVVCTTGGEGADELDARLSRSWLRVGVAAIFAGQGMVFSLAVNMTPPPYGSVPYWVLHGGLLFSALVVLGFLGGPLLASTWGMLRARRLSIEGLFTLSLAGALAGSVFSSLTGEGAVFYEVVAIVIAIYTIGRMLGERSQAKLALQSERLRERYETAEVLDESGGTSRMPVAELLPGCRVRVGPGTPFTVDGVVLSGEGYVRETALTGEPLPVVRRAGDAVRAGTWSEDGLFTVEARAVEGERELDGILRTVEGAGGRPSELQAQANQLIQSFLPLVAGVSAATAIFWAFTGTWVDAVLNSMAVLLVACPCALGLATPVAIWQGLFRLAQMGLVSRDGALIDVLARTRHVFFDKTGTLSEASLRVTEQWVEEAWRPRREELFAGVRAVERRAAHPVAASVAAAIEGADAETPELRDFRLVPGKGVAARVVTAAGEALELKIGEPELGGAAASAVEQADSRLREQGGKRVYVFADGGLAAVFVLRERPREGLDRVWAALREQSIRATVLTGDPRPEFDLPGEVTVRAGQSAAEKARRIRQAREQGELPLLVGDGLNDAGAMACAAASVAMGSGVGLTRAVAGGQLRDDRLAVLPGAIELARRIHRQMRGNLVYAAAYNVVGMGLAAAGWLHPVAAALIMLVSSFVVTSRALRAAGPPEAGDAGEAAGGAGPSAPEV
ncbi:MAG: heavy metal translocating P-type ATPase [Opitutales bacterium]